MTHPITPPPELVSEWAALLEHYTDAEVFAAAAKWGADQELEACCEWIPKQTPWDAQQLRAARRPKPPSLKERALQALAAVQAGTDDQMAATINCSAIRRALEALPND